MVKRQLVVLLLLLLTGGVLLTRAHGEDSASTVAAQVEGRQSPNRRDLDSFTLQEIMQKYRVPGVSVAVISGFRVHWAKGYGAADVETDRGPGPVEQSHFRSGFRGGVSAEPSIAQLLS